MNDFIKVVTLTQTNLFCCLCVASCCSIIWCIWDPQSRVVRITRGSFRKRNITFHQWKQVSWTGPLDPLIHYVFFLLIILIHYIVAVEDHTINTLISTVHTVHVHSIILQYVSWLNTDTNYEKVEYVFKQGHFTFWNLKRKKFRPSWLKFHEWVMVILWLMSKEVILCVHYYTVTIVLLINL